MINYEILTGGVFLSENDNLLIFYPPKGKWQSFDYYRDGKWSTEKVERYLVEWIRMVHEYDLVCEL
jgi:hypothetical protein